MDKLTPTDIIALVGCVTGVSSFFITFSKFFAERQRLKIVNEIDSTCYFNKFDQFNHYCCDKQGIARFSIINKSRMPITIYKIDAFTNDERIPLNDDFPTRPNIFISVDSNGIDSYVIDVSSKLCSPITLRPFESVYGYFFLSLLPNSIEENYNVKFKFYTSRSNKTMSITVKPICDKHSNCYNNY